MNLREVVLDKKPILYLLIEIKARELEGRTLLALEAASRGFRVVVGHKEHISKGLWSGLLPPGIYFDKSLTRGKEKKLGKVLDNGCLLVSQDEEAGLLNYSYDKFISIRSTSETVSMAKSIFCWGKHEYKSWIKYSPNSSHKMHLTGSPRIDYWRQDFQRYFETHIDSIKKRFGEFVLVSSNFTQANSYMTVNERIERAKRIGAICNKKDEETKRKSIEDRKKLFNYFIGLIDYVSDRFENIQFLVRPHPAEKISGWKSNLPVKDNIKIVFEGGISPWVHASSAVLHNACTTGIEAYVAGIPTLAYIPFPSDRSGKIPNKLSINCTNKEQVSEVLSMVINGESVNEHRTPENDQLIRNRLANVNGDTAAKRIVDVLATLDVPKAPPIKSGIGGWKMEAKTEIRRFLNKIYNIETKSMRKFSGLKLQELKQIQNNLAAVTNKYMECEIKHLYGDVFVVEKP